MHKVGDADSRERGCELSLEGPVIGLKSFEPSEEIPNCVAVNTANLRVSLFTLFLV